MKVLIFVLLILINCNYSLCQQLTQTIKGKVLDESSKAPVAFANVVLLNADPLIGTTSDINGNFRIENVPVGRYDIQVSFIGYESSIIKEVFVSSSKETVVQVSLKEKIKNLNEVVVRAKVNKEEPLNSMATVSARMLSVEEANRYAGGFDDPARLASSFAGVASNVASNGIVIRGNAPKSLQWKMEGVEIPNPNHFADMSAFGGGGITALSSQMLSNSDFLTGAFPAEYNNSLSGVFDLFMRNGNNQKHEHVFQAGLIGIDASSEGPFKKGGQSSYLFNYRYSTLALIMPLLPEEAQGTRYQDLSFKLNFPTNKLGVFSVWGIGLIDRSGQIAEKDSSRWYYEQHRENAGVKQYMGASGISNSYFFNNNTHLTTTIAATQSGLDLQMDRLNNQLELLPLNRINNINSNLIFTTSINKKFNAHHLNKTGFTATGLMYNMLLRNAHNFYSPLVTIVDESGFSSLLSAYTSSSYHLNNRIVFNIGLNGQLFTLNNNYTIEPRAGLKYKLMDNQHIGFAYGMHSRLERLNYYFTKDKSGEILNKNMDFTKAHHLVLSYGYNLSENMMLKIEPYYQQLFNVPIIVENNFSFINLQNQWFIDKKTENKGQGRNYGIDITLERYLKNGFYYLITASLFDSKYTGGDGIWRNTMFNRNFLLNFLSGKEWMSGQNGQKVYGVNVRFTFQGGDRYTPVNETESILAQKVIYNESQAFSKQFSPAFLSHFSLSRKSNRKKSSHEISLKVLNATMHGDFFGFRYNYIKRTIDEHREVIMFPNLSYKIEF
jgi:hypothetical protein